ncbi:hypothetical protein D3C84_1282270 [compost metagenome]
MMGYVKNVQASCASRRDYPAQIVQCVDLFSDRVGQPGELATFAEEIVVRIHQ